MGPVNSRLVEQARSIFADLGYSVEGTGPGFRAERDWKVVTVTPLAGTETIPNGSETYHCFVTEPDQVDPLERRLEQLDPSYEWAIIAIDGDEYAVERAPEGPVVGS